MGGTLGHAADTPLAGGPARPVAARTGGGPPRLCCRCLERSRGRHMSRPELRLSGHLPVSPPTLADVAERAGVSRQTVSNAVNNPDLLRPNTLERVRHAIEE